MDNTIGLRIKQRRKELKITQTYIQDNSSISSGNLSCIENGKYLPSTTSLLELSKILNCSIDWILTGKSSISNNQNDLSEAQHELLDTYNKLDSRGQHRVHTVIYEELDRMKNNNNEQKNYKDIPLQEKGKIII